MRRQRLERHLVEHGCAVLREGMRHTIWHNAAAGARAPVPWHSELPAGTVRAICSRLAVPAPPGVS